MLFYLAVAVEQCISLRVSRVLFCTIHIFKEGSEPPPNNASVID